MAYMVQNNESDLDALSLDEIIRLKRARVTCRSGADLSLEEYINAIKGGDPSSVKKTKTDTICQSAPDYSNITLDDIIYEKRNLKRATKDSKITAWARNNEDKADSDRSDYKLVPADKQVVLKPLDPCTFSLDDLIDKPTTSKVTTLKRKHAAAMDKKDEPGSSIAVVNMTIPSPRLTAYRAVGFMAENGMTIEIIVGRLREDTGDRSHLWRCIVSCGDVKATVDSLRKVVAREIACREFLTQLREMYKDAEIPEYEVPDELFIDPRIFHSLEKEAVSRALEVSNEVTVKPVNKPKLSSRRNVHYCYVCTYMVGKDKFTGESYVVEYAKLLAAREAYTGITGKEPLPTKYFTGKECDLSLEYEDAESEVFQTMAPHGNALMAIE